MARHVVTGSFSFSSSPYFYFFTLDERAVRFSEECQLLSVGLFKFQLIFKSLADNMAEASGPRNADSVIENSRASYRHPLTTSTFLNAPSNPPLLFRTD